MNTKEILLPMFQDMGLARVTKRHCLVIQDVDGSVLTVNTAPGTPAWRESLCEQAQKMHCPAWVQTIEVPNDRS